MQATEQTCYRVLARKYRPQNFDDLMGQEQLVRVLTNGIESGRLPHAIILSGVRGVGKTTSARIIARALNCIGPDGQGKETINPCGQCEPCLAISQDRHIDVIEMDAASRTGVDDVREVIDSSRYKAVTARYKIFIIDEVHMLSKSAFNALLKTLEEPPEHVKFIFATTEIRRVPDTVLSRCMRFDLRRLDHDTLMNLYTKVVKAEDMDIETGALHAIARTADGSARDGMSILDQAMTVSPGKITQDSVRDMLGLADRKQSLDLFIDLLKGRTKEAILRLKTLYERGIDCSAVFQDLMDITHSVNLLKVSPDFKDNLKLDNAEQKTMEELASTLSTPLLVRFWQVLEKGVQEVQSSAYPVYTGDMIVIRLCHIADLPTPDQLIKAMGPRPQGAPKSAVSSHNMSDTTDTGTSQALSSSPSLTMIDGGKEEPDDAQETFSSPQSFKDVIKLFKVNREPILQDALNRDVCLIEFAPQKMIWELKPEAAPNLVAKVKESLEKWTAQEWTIELQSSGGAPTLIEQEKAFEAQVRSDAGEDPLVKSALDTFPGAEIKEIKKVAS